MTIAPTSQIKLFIDISFTAIVSPDNLPLWNHLDDGACLWVNDDALLIDDGVGVARIFRDRHQNHLFWDGLADNDRLF